MTVEDEKKNSKTLNSLHIDEAFLDIHEPNLTGVVRHVIECLGRRGKIPQEHKESTVELLSKNLVRETSCKTPLKTGNSLDIPAEATEEDETTFKRKPSFRESLTQIFRLDSSGKYKIFNSDSNFQHLSPDNCYTNVQINIEDEDNNSLVSTEDENSENTAVLITSVNFVSEPLVVFVRLAEAIQMSENYKEDSPVRFVYIIFGPFNDESEYEPFRDAISNAQKNKNFCKSARNCKTLEELKSSLPKPKKKVSICNGKKHDNMEMSSLEIPKIMVEYPDDSESICSHTHRNPLERKGKLFYGLIEDLKIRYPQYWSDIKDGINMQVFSSIIFIFFAVLSPTITFGSMYGDQTEQYIGVGETLLVSSINGMMFALFAAQPLLIIGSTGPLMIFDMSLLGFCKSMELDFLSIRVWVGIWIFLVALVFAAFEGVFVVKLFTKFTEEIFSTFVCFIFIYGAFEKLANIFREHPLGVPINCTQEIIISNSTSSSYEISPTAADEILSEPNTALLSFVLMMSTFLIAWELKKMRNSKYFARSIRRALGDFGVPIAIFVMVLVSYFLHETHIDKLKMPNGLFPSNTDVRGWLINPFGVTKPLPIWAMIAALPASLLLFILVFLEENISQLILSTPQRCLKKGNGFHFDLVLACFANTIAGVLGAPFMTPACVRSITHASSLSIMGPSILGRPPKIIGCHEQRLSAFVVSLLLGLSTLLYMVLNHVPNPVLYGIFLYMGVSATAGIQFLDRIVLFIIPAKYHGETAYTKISTKKMHVFTIIQLILLIVLWILKQTPASLAVPFFIMCFIPFRLYILPYLFSNEELVALDGAPDSKKKKKEADFYETSHALPTQIDDELMGPRPSIADLGRRLSTISQRALSIRK